ncbi:MAG: hypothetical protein ACM3P1_04995 [Candidatus Saccharibacteria bacterium]
MDRKLTDRIMSVLLTTSVLLIIVGTICKVQHWPHGDIIQHTGFVFSIILGGIEIKRLRRVIRGLEESTSEAR